MNTTPAAPLAIALCLVSIGMLADTAVAAPQTRVKSLMTRTLDDIPNKEALVLEVEYPPAGADPVHRHNAHGFIYVVEGSIVMGVAGGKQVTLKTGDTFYEGPTDLHTIGRNASNRKKARFVVFLVKEKGAPAVLPP